MDDMTELTTERAFEKHKVLGEIFAVEWIVAPGFSREAVGAMRCTKPEQLTRGALPVLPINSSELDFYKGNCLEFAEWEPPMVNEDVLAAIVEAERVCQEAEDDYERAAKAAKLAKQEYERACDELRHVARAARTTTPPLLALMEAAPPTTDADTENQNDDRDD